MPSTSDKLYDLAETCPVSEFEWNERAANMSCGEGATGTKLRYHCLTMYPNHTTVESCMVRQPVDPTKSGTLFLLSLYLKIRTYI